MVRSWIFGLVAIALVFAAGAYWFYSSENTAVSPASYDDMLVVDAPLPGSEISSPYTVTGKARGGWYFEASFPIKLLDADGKVLWQGPAQAQGDWMTSEYVPFKVSINFITSSKTGTLEIHNDNPSGLPENDKELKIPVRLAPSNNTSFSAEGNVTRNNPGQKPDIWYLVYETPGKPSLSVELDLNSATNPYIELTQGERVRVEGILSGDVVTVKTITQASPVETGTHLKLYYYNPSLDQGPGGAQCSSKGLVAVERVIPKTTTPLKDSIQLLLRGELSDEERAQGITTEFPLSGVSLKSATIVNGLATLTFTDPQNKTGGGSCRVAILWAQISATAKQFPTVKDVRYMPGEVFQP